jgi:thiol-disulfide isomerase/thioredoxin
MRLLELKSDIFHVCSYTKRCGPCLLMAPEFEAAASELAGKVRFVKIDTDKEPEMAGRLNVMGLPTLLFLGEHKPEGGEEVEDSQPQAVLKDRIEGALRKDSIIALSNYHFFGGERPEQL